MRKKLPIISHNYIEKVRNYDNETKKRWLIVSSTISAIIIIGVWAAYINVTISNVGNSASTVSEKKQNIIIEKTTAKNTAESSFFQTLGRGAYITFKKIGEGASSLILWIKNKFENLKQNLDRKNTLFIEGNKNIKYVPQNFEPLPKTNLP